MARCSRKCWRDGIMVNLMAVMTLVSVLFGIVVGIILKHAAPKDFWTERRSHYVGFLGELFLRMMTLVVVPLISATIIQALGSAKVEHTRIIAFKGGLYYISMTLIAVVIGISLVTVIMPGKESKGKGLKKPGAPREDECGLLVDSVIDIFRSLFPPNILEATMALPKTRLILVNCIENGTNKTCYNYKSCKEYEQAVKPKPSLEDFKTEVDYIRGANFMGIIVYSTALAIALVFIGEKGKPMIAFFSGLAEATIIMTTWIAWFSPIGIASLVAGEILQDEDIHKKLYSLSYYVLTVMSGFLIHGLIVLPGVFLIFTRKLPFKFIYQISKALLTAFGTSSSSATVPVTIQCLEQNCKIDSRVVRFLIPMGSTLNLAGTALYEAVGAIYIAQVAGRDLSFAQILLVSLTSTLASIGAAGVPAAGVLTMVLVLKSIQLDPELVYLVISLDWILDRFQTVVNVLGDAMGVAIVYHLTQGDFEKQQSVQTDKNEEEGEVKEAEDEEEEGQMSVVEVSTSALTTQVSTRTSLESDSEDET